MWGEKGRAARLTFHTTCVAHSRGFSHRDAFTQLHLHPNQNFGAS